MCRVYALQGNQILFVYSTIATLMLSKQQKSLSYLFIFCILHNNNTDVALARCVLSVLCNFFQSAQINCIPSKEQTNTLKCFDSKRLTFIQIDSKLTNDVIRRKIQQKANVQKPNAENEQTMIFYLNIIQVEKKTLEHLSSSLELLLKMLGNVYFSHPFEYLFWKSFRTETFKFISVSSHHPM